VAQRVAIIGAGAMGLAAAYHAAKAGHQVRVFEAAPEPGGMAGHFNFGGLSIERFYHFVCKDDLSTFELLDELELGDRMRWRPTSMAYFVGGRLHSWGDPLALLSFPELDLLSKLRYGALMFLSANRRSWADLEHISAREWITRWCGAKTYDLLWRRLFDLKFHEYADNISAAWVWARIRRAGRSRRSLMQEELGYIEGGSQTLVTALVSAIQKLGGDILLAHRTDAVVTKGGRVRGVRAGGTEHACDHVILTVPIPFVSAMVPDLPADWKQRYDAILNIGVACVVLKLRRSMSPHFWVNILDPAIELPGLIEFSNLRPVSDTIVYAPYYMPATNPKWRWSDADLVDHAFIAIRAVNPSLTEADRIDAHVARLRYAQPVCAPGFARMLPPVQTPIAGLQVADTCFYYPEDRGIAESVRLGKRMAQEIGRGSSEGK
jgi:protoporphyrinogen oxidase